MPHEIILDSVPAGYVVEASSTEAPGLAKIVVREFTSSEDGELLISRLEGIPNELISRLPPQTGRPSTLDHLVAIIRDDRPATVYVNECNIMVQFRSARAIQAGEFVREDDIVDVGALKCGGLDFPPEAGVVFLMSAGWRKGLFFDLIPLGPEHQRRGYDIEKQLGSYFAYLLNQNVFSLAEPQWTALIEQQWFPFVSLQKALLRKMVAHLKSGGSVDVLLPQVVDRVRGLIPAMLGRWSKSALFQSHLELLRHASSEFLEGDFVSCTAIVYPRIEGLLRSLHESLGIKEKASQSVLSRASIQGRQDELHQHSWLLPDKFTRYLEEAYFAGFEPGKPAKLSRHTLGHGVASGADFNQKAACIGLLVLDQLFYMLPSDTPANQGLQPTALRAIEKRRG